MVYSVCEALQSSALACVAMLYGGEHLARCTHGAEIQLSSPAKCLWECRACSAHAVRSFGCRHLLRALLSREWCKMHSVLCTRVSTLHVSKSPTECLFLPLDGQEVTPKIGL